MTNVTVRFKQLHSRGISTLPAHNLQSLNFMCFRCEKRLYFQKLINNHCDCVNSLQTALFEGHFNPAGTMTCSLNTEGNQL